MTCSWAARSASYAVEDAEGPRTIAIIDDRTAYGAGRRRRIREGRQGAGGKIVAREFTNDKATDFTAILTSHQGQEARHRLLRRHGRAWPARWSSR